MHKQLKAQIDRLKAAGATYVDARWYPVEEANYLMMWNGNLKETASSKESGLGVRVLYKNAWGFSASSDLNDLSNIFEKALVNAKVAAERVTFPVRLAEKDAVMATFKSPNRIDPFSVTLEEKIDFLKTMDEKLNQPGVVQRVSEMMFMKKQIV
ncbi:MAG TPA: DNA gyrase modulator, partial [Anaerolineaceae bacterium]|nr:DNA gyrase modulator [Anaerolineaceae bacterium]